MGVIGSNYTISFIHLVQGISGSELKTFNDAVRLQTKMGPSRTSPYERVAFKASTWLAFRV